MKLSAQAYYILYGFCRANPNETGYLYRIPDNEDDLEVVTHDSDLAYKFTEDNVKSAQSYINNEFKDLYGKYAYAFHPVKMQFSN